jgi:hypothetical protein
MFFRHSNLRVGFQFLIVAGLLTILQCKLPLVTSFCGMVDINNQFEIDKYSFNIFLKNKVNKNNCLNYQNT